MNPKPVERPVVVLYFPVQPHVYKFLHAKCGEKLTATNHSLYGNVVFDILKKRGKETKMAVGEFSYPVEIHLPYFADYGIIVDDTVIRKFNVRIDRLFREEMYSFVRINYENHAIPKDASIKSFMQGFNITEDDIKFETLKRDMTRNVVTK